jgi:hypothetical protein
MIWTRYLLNASLEYCHYSNHVIQPLNAGRCINYCTLRRIYCSGTLLCLHEFPYVVLPVELNVSLIVHQSSFLIPREVHGLCVVHHYNSVLMQAGFMLHHHALWERCCLSSLHVPDFCTRSAQNLITTGNGFCLMVLPVFTCGTTAAHSAP